MLDARATKEACGDRAMDVGRRALEVDDPGSLPEPAVQRVRVGNVAGVVVEDHRVRAHQLRLIGVTPNECLDPAEVFPVQHIVRVGEAHPAARGALETGVASDGRALVRLVHDLCHAARSERSIPG